MFLKIAIPSFFPEPWENAVAVLVVPFVLTFMSRGVYFQWVQ